jgi:hypothetical protein
MENPWIYEAAFEGKGAGQPGCQEIVLKDDTTKMVICWLHCMPGMEKQMHTKARRMVAEHNAVLAVETETLEKIVLNYHGHLPTFKGETEN